ncbi:MAG: polysaccharide biosynthesis tyrosine autokinase [Clostridium sp.]|nr:polysaccharide biosynthesis tyrosine autokinase [Clostridium sp.]
MQDIEIKKEEQDFRTEEAYKTLRTNIEFSGEELKAVCVTSCIPGEGKSSVSFGLARSFAQNGRKTLLVDADLRKSAMRSRHKRGKVRYGLTNHLAGKAAFSEALCATDIQNLYLIFAGPVPPNPSELLGSGKFRRMMEEARKVFDMVVVDTPPLGSVIDAAVVSRCCDGALFVVQCGAVSYRLARRVKEQLSAAGCRSLGCVLNRASLSGREYGYYGGYYGSYDGS